MATASKTYTFTAGTSAAAAEVNKNFDDVIGFLNGSSLIHADGTKAFTGYPLLPVAAPSNARHPATKQYVDDKSSSRLVGSVALPTTGSGVAYSAGNTDASGYTFATISVTVSAQDVIDQTKFIVQGELGPITWITGAAAYNHILTLQVDGVTVPASDSHRPMVLNTPQNHAFSFRYVPSTAGTKTFRLRLWQADAGSRNFWCFGGWWGVMRTAP
jgi:hypothetical protein